MSWRILETDRARHRIEWHEGVERLILPSQGAAFGTAFLSVWLTAWVWGGGKAMIKNVQDPLVVVWFVLWFLSLVAMTLMLIGRISGADVVVVRHGELVITRRAGPLSRTWRYSAAKIFGLRVDTSRWTADDDDGSQYVPFVKQQWGSVRFEYGAETVHLAPHVDLPEAAQIADWLKRRLPVSSRPGSADSQFG
jgi:hypothetical protein